MSDQLIKLVANLVRLNEVRFSWFKAGDTVNIHVRIEGTKGIIFEFFQGSYSAS
jgi:hypothetical protein